MTLLYIAEKPEVAKAIVGALGLNYDRRNGYFECTNGDKVTYCFGHMLELCTPEDYDPGNKEWSFNKLPLINIPWKKKPIQKNYKQLCLIKDLLQVSSEVIHAGDPDEEGQLLIDEILDYYECKLPVKRLLLNDNNPNMVKKMLSKMQDNKEFRKLSQSAEARSVADQMYGFNLTRAYTILAQKQGYQGVLSVGRVQTPILGLVVRRDIENAQHKASYYYRIIGNFNISNKEFSAEYITQEKDNIDEKKRITDKNIAENIVQECENKTARILAAKISHKKESPPLPYNLLKLQADCAKKYGLSPSEVKDITQNLREKYQLITYNRSDCQFLNDEHHIDAPYVLETLRKNIPQYATTLDNANYKIKSRAFDNEKVTAHHAIIPTQAQINLDILTPNEKNVYLLIAYAYILQFYPQYEYDQTILTIEVGKRKFECINNITTFSGWRILYQNNDEDLDEVLDLRSIEENDEGICERAEVKETETKPRPLYTMETLLADLTKVAKYVKNDKLRQLLIDKDKDKPGENGGIGTPATRDVIIKGLFDKGFLVIKDKKVISTEIGKNFYNILPDIAKYPDMTALWHEQQTAIKEGDLSTIAFIENLAKDITNEVQRVQIDGIKINKSKYLCQHCHRPLRRLKGANGYFWGCTGYSEGKCAATYSDRSGRPLLMPQKKEISKRFFCQKCRGALVRREGKEKGSYFWGCSNYPNCKQFYRDESGKPVFN